MRRTFLLGVLCSVVLVWAIWGNPAGCFESNSLEKSAFFKEIGDRNKSGGSSRKPSGDEPFHISPFGE